jgi:peptidoglycan/LPS O-acetylase OafA/YrhL
MDRAFRADIQALRGLAVLLVVLYHADFGLVPAGYLGVDIFFVISGFLITGLIMTQLEQRRFSYWQFYYRRARACCRLN